MTKRKILVVEDNADNMTLITDVLAALNYESLSARDGEDALRVVREHKPDLILMDLALPKVDGWTATKQIKADAELKHIPIIALTAFAMHGDRERALAAGCDDYLSKPISLKELAEKLRNYLSPTL